MGFFRVSVGVALQEAEWRVLKMEVLSADGGEMRKKMEQLNLVC